MYYLVDTNVFLHAINESVYSVAQLCKDKDNDVTITETILNELEPGYYLALEDETAKQVYNSVSNLAHGTMGLKVIRILNVADVPGAKEELKKIRDRYYMWMRDGTYLQSLIAAGKLTVEDIKKKSFRNKDLGECELIAIAKTSTDDYEIVTNDKGRVFLHPEQNLFDDYASNEGLIVLSSDEWLEKIGYKED